jgi:hypothetical protein
MLAQFPCRITVYTRDGSKIISRLTLHLLAVTTFYQKNASVFRWNASTIEVNVGKSAKAEFLREEKSDFEKEISSIPRGFSGHDTCSPIPRKAKGA